jgi:hypothetical protein
VVHWSNMAHATAMARVMLAIGGRFAGAAAILQQ